MARIVDPTLADMPAESRRPAWLGYLALARALALHAVVSAPGAAARLYHDDDRAVPRALALGALATLLLTVPLVAIPAKTVVRISWHAVVLLVPQAVTMSLPVSLLVALPLAFRGMASRRRLVTRGLVLSVLCALATLVLMIQVLPDANQAFRIEAARHIDPSLTHIPRGPIEMTLHELREKIDILRLTPGGVIEARRLEYTLHMKLAMSAIPLPLGLLAIAITRAARGRARSIAIGIASMLIYVYGVFVADAWALLWLRRSEAASPAVLAWTPAMLIAAVALAIIWTSRAQQAHAWA